MGGLYLIDISGQEKKNEDTVGVPLLGVSQGRWGSRNHTPCLADCEVFHGVIITEQQPFRIKNSPNLHFVGFFIYIMLECKENSYTKPTANLALKFLFQYMLKRKAFFTYPSTEEAGQFARPGVAVKPQMRLYMPLSRSVGTIQALIAVSIIYLAQRT